jgi:hypothetical protein
VPDIAPASSGLELPDVDVSGLDGLDEGAVVLVPVLLVLPSCWWRSRAWARWCGWCSVPICS